MNLYFPLIRIANRTTTSSITCTLSTYRCTYQLALSILTTAQRASPKHPNSWLPNLPTLSHPITATVVFYWIDNPSNHPSKLPSIRQASNTLLPPVNKVSNTSTIEQGCGLLIVDSINSNSRIHHAAIASITHTYIAS